MPGRRGALEWGWGTLPRNPPSVSILRPCTTPTDLLVGGWRSCTRLVFPPSGRDPVTTSTWVTMILIVGFVWGGFVVAVVTAFRKESDKAD